MPSFVRVYCSSWENTHMVLQSGPSSIWELLSFRPLLIFSIPHAHLSDSYSRLLRSVSLSIRKRRRLSFPDLIWVAKQKRVWNNPAECDLTHSGVRCSKRGLNIFLKNQVLEQIMAKKVALLRRSVLLLLFPSCLLFPILSLFFNLQLSTMSPALLNKIPEEVREHVKMLLSVTPNVRPDADQMTKVWIVTKCMQIQRNWYFFIKCAIKSCFYSVFLWHSDSIFWRRGCHDPAVLWLPLPKGQSAEVPVLQRSPQSAAQTTQGSTTKCRGCIFIFRCTSYEMSGDMYSGELSGQKPNPTLGFILFLLLSESGGVSNPAGADLRVHQPGHGSLRAAQRAADRRGVHQGRVHPPHPARPHACFQAARANSGRTQHSANAMCVRTFVRQSWVVVR